MSVPPPDCRHEYVRDSLTSERCWICRTSRPVMSDTPGWPPVPPIMALMKLAGVAPLTPAEIAEKPDRCCAALIESMTRLFGADAVTTWAKLAVVERLFHGENATAMEFMDYLDWRSKQ